MRIALVTKRFDPSLGGAERYAQTLARSFFRSGHQVHVISPYFSSPLPEGIEAHPISPGKHIMLPEVAACIPQAREMVSQLSCDITYALTLHYPADLYRAGDGIFCHWHRLNHPQAIARWGAGILGKRRTFLSLERKLYAKDNCKGFITNSSLVKRHIIQYHDVSPEKIHVVHNGVDHSVFCPENREFSAKRRRELGVSEHTMLVLFVAHNWKRKGLETLLRGAASFVRQKQVKIAVVGRGKPRSWVSLLRRLGISEGVFFAESTGNIAKWYRIADVMALPTLYDPFANVCLESMACGTPVITTRENGVAELIEPGKNGFVLSSPFAEKELEEYLAAFRDRDFAKKCGENAQRTALNFPVEKNVQKTLEVFQKVRDANNLSP